LQHKNRVKMFKKHTPPIEPSLLTGIRVHLSGRKLDILLASSAWHNVFFQEITSRIEESPYSQLFSNMGRPNAPIRVLLAMMILKEGHSWTDEQLFNECRFNLQVMCALGLPNLTNDVPSESTYYDFKSRLVRHMEKHKIDLLSATFASLSSDQIVRYKVSGRELRMDSKLFNSNIMCCSRLQLVIGVLQKFYRKQDKATLALLAPNDQLRLEQLSGKSTDAHVYPLTGEEKKGLLEEMGNLLARIDKIFKDPGTPDAIRQVPEIDLVHRVLMEQFNETEGQAPNTQMLVYPKDKAQMKGAAANTLQSPHDPDAGYRKKESGQKTQIVHGYSSNITESCEKGEAKNQKDVLHLITSVQTEIVTTGDSAFFQTAVEQSEAVSGQKATDVWTDGAYNSQPNADFVEQRKEEKLTWHLNNIQGAESEYSFAYNDQEKLIVTDSTTKQSYEAISTSKGLYRIPDKEGNKSKYRYFDDIIVRNYFRRQAIAKDPAETRNRRASVESTIHQVFCTLRGNKSPYRSKARSHIFVLCRCLWVNCRRIEEFITQLSRKTASMMLNSANQFALACKIKVKPIRQPLNRDSFIPFKITIFYSVMSMNFY
jgi:Transposase domain (DUF772)/Transposase DDE domain